MHYVISGGTLHRSWRVGESEEEGTEMREGGAEGVFWIKSAGE
jgi:hypothetical protein